MANEVMGSVTRTVVSAAAGLFMGLAVEGFEITPDMLETILNALQKIADSLQGLLSLLTIVLVQGWSIYQKMDKNKQLTKLKKEIKYND